MRDWAAAAAAAHPETVRIGCFGSYARGDAGVGSDVDLIVIVDHTGEPFASRARHWDATMLPVPADVLVYTSAEWEAIRSRRFGATVGREVVWVYERRSG
ncbi:nucleotidyltransferase domain-containing protein [Candidatus Binatia bacterium]|nr:nucleotidyltransferase domain-containing protein [Candidatus Binatia bacterium]